MTTTYASRAKYVEPRQTVEFLDVTLPADVFGVPVRVATIVHEETQCHVTTRDGTAFSVAAIAQVRIEDCS